MRIGQGWDLHRLDDNLPLIIGGIEIPSNKGCVAHSDGDVLIHALIDALLGAIAAGDIGSHYPDSDPSFKDIDSMKLLENTMTIVRKNGYKVLNIDSTVVIERPKLRPFIDLMRKNLAAALEIDTGAVSVKAKTKEGMEADNSFSIEASVSVLIEKI